LIPIGISPVVVGLLTLALAGYLPRSLTSSWILLPLIQVLFALPVAYQILRPSRLAIDPELLEASRLDGAGRYRTAAFIELPLLRKSIGLAIAFGAMVSIGEFGAASFLAFGSNETLPIVLFKLLSRPGEVNLGMAMAVAAIYILISAYVIWLSLKPKRIALQSS
jgi:thiamine transport system permease protein